MDEANENNEDKQLEFFDSFEPYDYFSYLKAPEDCKSRLEAIEYFRRLTQDEKNQEFLRVLFLFASGRISIRD
jgi:hypothetical protein